MGDNRRWPPTGYFRLSPNPLTFHYLYPHDLHFPPCRLCSHLRYLDKLDDDAAAHHAVAGVDDGRLAGRDGTDVVRQLDAIRCVILTGR